VPTYGNGELSFSLYLERHIMEKFLTRLQQQAEENPIMAIAVGVAVLTAASKFLNAAGSAYGRRTWSKEVNRRARKASKK